MLNEGSEIRPFSPVAGATWMSATVDADGNVTTHQGTEADMPADLFDHASRGLFVSEARAVAGGSSGGGGSDGPIEICVARVAVSATGAGSAGS